MYDSLLATFAQYDKSQFKISSGLNICIQISFTVSLLQNLSEYIRFGSIAAGQSQEWQKAFSVCQLAIYRSKRGQHFGRTPRPALDVMWPWFTLKG